MLNIAEWACESSILASGAGAGQNASVDDGT